MPVQRLETLLLMLSYVAWFILTLSILSKRRQTRQSKEYLAREEALRHATNDTQPTIRVPQAPGPQPAADDSFLLDHAVSSGGDRLTSRVPAPPRSDH